MPESRMPASAAHLLEQLRTQGFSPSDNLPAFVAIRHEERELPLMVRILIAVGAILTAVFICSLLFEAELVSDDSPGWTIFWGFVFVVVAIGLQWFWGTRSGVRYAFLMLPSLALMIAGKFFLVSGWYWWDLLDFARPFRDMWNISLALFAVTIATYFIYRLPIERFISTLAALLSVYVSIDTSFLAWVSFLQLHLYPGTLLNAFLLVQIIAAALLFTWGRVRQENLPLAYALVISLVFGVLLIDGQDTILSYLFSVLTSSWFITVVLSLGLIALFIWVSGGLDKIRSEPVILACGGAVLLGFLQAPGILLSITLLVLGYARQDRLLFVLGIVLLPIFLALYYYNLDMTLLAKSGVLAGTGVFLLAGRFYLRWKGWDQEPAT